MNRYIALSWVAIAGIGVIIGWFVYLFFFIDLSGPPKILLSDLAILQPVLDSSEGKAFTARYPNYHAEVTQDFYMTRCCNVILSSTGLNNNSQTATVQFLAYVSVSSDLRKISVDDDMRLWCILPEGGWTVKGNIVQNLRTEQPDCWESGAPPRATDQDLVDIASSTTAGKAYLSRYPENDILIHRDRYVNNGDKVRFTPKVSEPFEFAVMIGGFDRVITQTYLVCSGGEYRNPEDPKFWSYFEPSNDCLQSVHDKLVVASETAQVKAFQEKYPVVALHAVDSSSRFTVTSTDSTIKYLFTGVKAPGSEAILIVAFKPGTTEITDFEVQCGQEASSAGTYPHISEEGIELDIAMFLQDSRCPAP